MGLFDDYFETLEATTFEERDDGKTVFYPWGVFGEGYVLETPEQEDRVRTFVRRYNIANVVVAPLLVGLLFGTVDALVPKLLVLGGILALVVTTYVLRMRHLIRNAPGTGSSPTLWDSLQRQATAYSFAQLWTLQALSLAFAAVGIWLIAESTSPWIGALSVVFFGAAGVVTGYQLVLKSRSSRSSPNAT